MRQNGFIVVQRPEAALQLDGDIDLCRLPQPGLRALDHASDAYVTAQLERSFRTLDYYKSILPQEETKYE